MEHEPWRKLYCKIALHDIIRDGVSLQIFIYLLSRAKEGKVIVSRVSTSKELDLKPSTFRDGLQRLVSKYEICDIKADRHYSIVRIVNWDKYQGGKKRDDKKDDISTTPGRHLDDTYIENKNKNRERASLSFLQNIPQEDLAFLKAGLIVNDGQIRDKAEDFYNYCTSKGRVYKDYRAALRNALKKDYPRDTGRHL